jgi:hypothetical protein
MDKLSPEERADYQAMLEKQQRKPVLKNKLSKEAPTDIDLVTEAYIHYLCLERGVALKEAVNVPNDLKDKIYKLYLNGVLPVRLGGVNIK